MADRKNGDTLYAGFSWPDGDLSVSAKVSWDSNLRVTIGTPQFSTSSISCKWQVKPASGGNPVAGTDSSNTFTATEGTRYVFQGCVEGPYPWGNSTNGSSHFTVTINDLGGSDSGSGSGGSSGDDSGDIEETGYTLTISLDNGSSVEVYRARTEVEGVSNGPLHNGSTVYAKDLIFAVPSALTGYTFSACNISGAAYVGPYEGYEVYRVNGNVVVSVTSQPDEYTLTVTQGTGSSVSIYRESTDSADGTGWIEHTAKIYYNDRLQISFELSDEYEFSSFTVNASEFPNASIHTVKGDVVVNSIATIRRYNLLLNPDTGTEIIVSRTSSPLQGAENTSWSSSEYTRYENVIYHSDVLEIEFTSSPGYEITQHLVNQKDFISGNMHNVAGDVEIVTISGLTGLVNIYNGTEFVKHLIYIYNGSTWDQYIPYVYDGTQWNICS